MQIYVTRYEIRIHVEQYYVYRVNGFFTGTTEFLYLSRKRHDNISVSRLSRRVCVILHRLCSNL